MSDAKKEAQAVPSELRSCIEQAQATAQRITDRLEHIQGKMNAMHDQTAPAEEFQPHRHLEQTANMLEDLMTQIDQAQAALKGRPGSDVGE